MTRLKRVYIALGILFFFIGMIAFGVYQRQHKIGGRGEFGKLLQELLNATTFSQIVLLPSIFVFLPVIIGIFTASSFAGEQQIGLIRTTAIRPVSRFTLIISRLVSLVLFSYFMLFLLLVISYVIGGLMFGFDGEVFCIGFKEIGQKKFYVLTEWEGLQTLVTTYFVSGFALISVISLFLMFAIIMQKQGNAIVSALGFYFVSFILTGMPTMEYLRPYLPTKYMMLWRYTLGTQIMWDRLMFDLAILSSFTLGFIIVSFLLFRRKDL